MIGLSRHLFLAGSRLLKPKGAPGNRDSILPRMLLIICAHPQEVGKSKMAGGRREPKSAGRASGHHESQPTAVSGSFRAREAALGVRGPRDIRSACSALPGAMPSTPEGLPGRGQSARLRSWCREPNPQELCSANEQNRLLRK